MEHGRRAEFLANTASAESMCKTEQNRVRLRAKQTTHLEVKMTKLSTCKKCATILPTKKINKLVVLQLDFIDFTQIFRRSVVGSNNILFQLRNKAVSTNVTRINNATHMDTSLRFY
jgi:hypothetical protein